MMSLEKPPQPKRMLRSNDTVLDWSKEMKKSPLGARQRNLSPHEKSTVPHLGEADAADLEGYAQYRQPRMRLSEPLGGEYTELDEFMRFMNPP
ncbi:uncharacterized protein MYCFIDRAFT_182770 [Pseudocercospora fijiensis CIRAD86]|uniref:Uncharacterized protein n=1 Tax=Pseudocercospora fijiensis (strain CIRAD86) TaxID=383855 RepID=M3B1L3_PSEFD|nr:uncharacterized protein MYCFIDRAFT_182770 [Pseudocercospora fijiensis CIRAD86]EME83292.1 hypothetical protein MYCFIDRAFT_182770 [Pseudocercospora fijiensis CIRAD86]